MREEHIEEIDWDGNTIAKHPKSMLKERMFPHKVSLVIPKTHDNKYIFCKRAKDKQPFPDTWVCGIGGRVSAGETYEQAAVREAKEGANVDLELEQVTEFKYDERDYKGIFQVFTTKNPIDIKNLNPDPREVQFFKAFSLDEIEKNIRVDLESFAPTFRAAIRAFIKDISK